MLCHVISECLFELHLSNLYSIHLFHRFFNFFLIESCTVRLKLLHQLMSEISQYHESLIHIHYFVPILNICDDSLNLSMQVDELFQTSAQLRHILSQSKQSVNLMTHFRHLCKVLSILFSQFSIVVVKDVAVSIHSRRQG